LEQTYYPTWVLPVLRFQQAYFSKLKHPSIKTPAQGTTDPGPHEPDWEVMMLGEDWREPYIDFIKD
jgi:hypothetical protein